MKRQDEIGLLVKSFQKMSAYIKNMVDTADRISAGDIEVKVKVQSENDSFGRSFASMVDSLQNQVTRKSSTPERHRKRD